MAAPKGNQNAKKAKDWERAIRSALNADRESLQRIARKVVHLAEEGQQWAVQEIGNRLDGKAPQSVDVTGDYTYRLARELTEDELDRELNRRLAQGEEEQATSSEEPHSTH